MILAQDPDELFDIVDAEGLPLGITKRRADVHRDGDWHRAIHVWVIGEEAGVGWLMCQRRSLDKDTWPGEWDVAVGGHLGAGETVAQAYREIEEEIGIAVPPTALRWVGRRLSVNDVTGAYLDREIQEIIFLRDDRPLEHYRPNPAELAGLVRLPLDPLLDLLAGDRGVITAWYLPTDASATEPIELTLASFRLTTDRYFYRVAIAARNLLRGDRHIAV